MPSEIRLKRIQDQIQRVLTEILETKVNDPRLEGVYVTDVTVDRELDYANIYVSALDSQGRIEDILKGLETASGFIRFNLSQEVKLRVMPKLRFYWDDTPDKADRIEELLEELRKEREARGVEEDDQTSETPGILMDKTVDARVAEKINASQRILITSHVRPDADAVGSLLGLGHALKNAGKSVQMVLTDGSERFQYLPGVEQITRSAVGETDMIIVLDCSDSDRVGSVLTGYGQPDLVVDHHKTNLAFGVINVVEPSQVATAAILFDRMPAWGLSIDANAAMCLLAGIIGDTIGFRTPNVDAAVLRRCAALIDLGGDLAHVYNEELVMRPFEAVRYWGSGLNRLEHEDGLVYTSLTLADRQDAGYGGDDDADLVNILSSVREAKIAVIFIEQKDHTVKVSWRTRPGLDVSGIATQFGGGGHAAAAGADVAGSLADVKRQVIQETQKLLEDSTQS